MGGKKKRKKSQPKWGFPSQTTSSIPNTSFIPTSLGVFRCALGYFHAKSLLRLNLGWELGCSLCIPDWGHSWEFPHGEQTQSYKSVASGVSLTSLLTEWFCCCNTRVCMKKSSQERFALKILLDRPKARNEVQFLLFSPKNLQLLGCSKKKNPTTKPPFAVCASRDLFVINWAGF